MTAAADYAKAAYALAHPSPPAYVSFLTSASARGISGDSEPEHIVFVRTKDGAVVAGSLANFSTGHYDDRKDTNPISRPVFKADCYAAGDEQQTIWENRRVLRITLRPVCAGEHDDAPFEHLYADPVSLEPLGVDGTMDDEGMSVDLNEHFARFGAYVLPSDFSVHVHGHGWLFWVRERATVTYSQYKFYERLPQGVQRRQATSGALDAFRGNRQQ